MVLGLFCFRICRLPFLVLPFSRLISRRGLFFPSSGLEYRKQLFDHLVLYFMDAQCNCISSCSVVFMMFTISLLRKLHWVEFSSQTDKCFSLRKFEYFQFNSDYISNPSVAYKKGMFGVARVLALSAQLSVSSLFLFCKDNVRNHPFSSCSNAIWGVLSVLPFG